MSATEEKEINYGEITPINQDEDSKKPEIKSEGNVPSLDSITNIENSGALSKNMSHSAAIEGSGDELTRILHENITKPDRELTEMSKEFINTGSGKGSGDYTAKAKGSDMEDKKVEDINIDIDLNQANPSKSNVNTEKDERDNSVIDKCDDTYLKMADDLDEMEEDDMELRWDDDDSSNQALGDDNGNTDAKNDDILPNTQILKESSDVITKGMFEMHSDENSKVNLKSDVLKDNGEKYSLTGENKTKDIDTTKESKIGTKLNISGEKSEDENIGNTLEDELLKEPDLSREAINSPEMDIPVTKSVDQDDTNVLAEKLLEESIIHCEMQEIAQVKEIIEQKHTVEPLKESELSSEMEVIAQVNEILEEKSLVEPQEESEIDSAMEVIAQVKEILKEKSMVESIEKTGSVGLNFLKEITTDKHAKEVPKDIIEENKPVTESESNTEMETITFKMSSFTDVILNKENDDVMLQENLLEEPTSKVESTVIIPEKEVPMKQDDDVMLEEKLLDETEIADIIPETDATMEVDDYNEGELLKDNESQDDSCTLMDIDNIDQSDDQTTKIVIDQPIEDSTNTIEMNKDLPSEEKAKTQEKILLLSETLEMEKKCINQKIIDYKNETEDQKDYIIVKTDTSEQSKNIPVQADTVTVSNNLIERKENPILESLKHEIEIQPEPEKPEEIKEGANRDTDLGKPPKPEQASNQVSNLDKNNETDEVASNNSSIFLEDSPVPIKTDHGLHKPDVMLEIPTQELIDMDDTDLSMNLDLSEVIDRLNDIDKNVEEDLELEKTVDKIVTEDDTVIEKSLTEADNAKAVTETTVDKITSKDETVNEKAVTEADDDTADPKAVTETTVDKITSKNDTGNEKSVTEAYDDTADLKVVSKRTVDKITSKDEVVNEKSVTETDDDIADPKAVTETTVDKITSKDDTVNEKSVSEAENDTADPKAVTETTVDKVTSKNDTVNEKSVTEMDDDIADPKAVTETTVDKITSIDDKVNEKSVTETDDDVADPKAVTETTVDKITSKNDTVNEKSVTDADDDTADPKAVNETTVDKITSKNDTHDDDQEAIVSQQTVSKTEKDSDIVENEKKVEDTAVQPTIEENMERMFADDESNVAKEVAECIATTTQVQVPSEQPSTSITRMTPDTSDELPEISDSLGLLAESAGRMMEDDEEPEDEDDADDDDDFDHDHDESSNQISAEQSEDSNPAALETEPVRGQEDKDLETQEVNNEEFPFICDSTCQDMAEKMDVEEYETAENMNEINEEAKSAVDALLKDNVANEQNEDQQETTDQMDIDTVKLSDTSDNEVDAEPTEIGQTVTESHKEEEAKTSPKQSPKKLSQSPSTESPNKMKNLAITAQAASAVVNIVDLEESSSSEDDIQEVQKQSDPETKQDEKPPSPDSDVTNVNIPTGIDIMCTSGGSTSEITTKEGEVVISGVPKPPPHKLARLNTSEISIKTVSNTEPMVIPETMINDQTPTSTQPKPKLSLEIFSLDSDDEDSAAKEKSPTTSSHKMTALEVEKARETSKCINYCCTSDSSVAFKLADAAEVAYYDAGRKRRSMVCQPCADAVADRTKNLVEGIKDLTPLLKLEMGTLSEDLVQISDSESEDEEIIQEEPKETIGEKGAKFIEDNLAKYLNETWKKYDMDLRLKETQIMLDDEIEKLEQDSKEIDAMLNECQVATDKLRCELYATFECRRQQLPSLVMFDTPESKFMGLEEQLNPPAVAEPIETRQAKRRLSSTTETPAKRPAIPLGYAPLNSKEKPVIPGPDIKIDDDRDITVVKLSAEAAPADLPPPGEISRPPLRVGMPVYAMKNAFGPWLRGRVLEMQPKNPSGGNPFSQCRVKFDHKTKTNGKVLNARCIAYSEPADVRMTIGTRLIALFKDMNKRESYYSGVVAEIPNPVNNYRYLVFFDDGYAQYVQHQFTRLVCESSPLVWEEVHPFSREFVRSYLLAYPERPMVRLHEGQRLKTEWNGKWWSSRVLRVDASLAQVMFVGDGRREWIYRGSTRLAPLYLELRAAERHRPRPMPRSKAQPRYNMPYVEYTRSDEQEPSKHAESQVQQQQVLHSEDIRRQRAVAKKSTSSVPQALPQSQDIITPHLMDPVTSRVVYYTPKNAVKPLKMVPHKCSPRCKRSDVLSLKELRTYNPLAKPLLSGWERQIVRFKGHKEVMYRAPCGRRLRNMRELHHYLRSIDSDLPVDLFDFHYSTHCLAEFVLNKCLVGKKDLSHGKENVPVPCVNYYDDSLPEFCSYNTERTPTAGVPLNLEPEFLCGCDCTDDCQDKSKCACWKMTLEGARTIGLRGPNVGYVYRRLPEPLPSGIYECNSRCKCKHTCLNRVAQHPLQLKLQVFKTPNRGWGIRALNDVPKGSFLCVYAGNLLTDATANLDGLNEGDEYLAELDYIEVVEQMKEGYEEDIPDADKKLDKKGLVRTELESEEDEQSTSEEEDTASKTDKEDDDFRPGYIGLGVMEFSKRLRKRDKSKKDNENSVADDKEKDTPKENETKKELNAEEDCITISDDEEVREPSRFMAQTNMGANEYISKYKSVRTLFGKDEACYIMDAKVQGNIGRYLNHSCCPNVFVQNVFVDTHDPRFPWVAFFALSHIKAGTELTWNYNYDVGSVPGKTLYCYCGAVNCRGRLL